MRFYTLDAMRGIAAIAIVILHITQQLGAKPEPFAYMAVDFFFMLSGFVLATAFEKKLRGGMSVSDFLRARIARLYPVYFLGAALGALVLLAIDLRHSGQTMGAEGSVVAVVFGFLMIPDPANIFLFPLNHPAWSLFYEFLINIFFAAIMVKLPTRVLAFIVLVAGIAYVAATIQIDRMTAGFTWDTAGTALIRVAFTFGLGVLFARAHFGAARLAPWTSTILALVLLGVLMVPVHDSYRIPYNIVATVMVFPALLWLGIRNQPSSALSVIGTALGDLSYPLYAIHYPTLRIASFAARALHLSNAMYGVLFLAFSCAVALATARFIEPTARRMLLRKLTPERVTAHEIVATTRDN